MRRPEQTGLLADKIVDPGGPPIFAAHTNKGKVCYRYDASRALHVGEEPTGLCIDDTARTRFVAS